jgi:hypothetical protein
VVKHNKIRRRDIFTKNTMKKAQKISDVNKVEFDKTKFLEAIEKFTKNNENCGVRLLRTDYIEKDIHERLKTKL